jgi:hypothetical protein
LKRDSAGARAQFLRVAELVAGATGVPIGEILAPGRRGRDWSQARCFARRATFYLTVTHFDVPASRLARVVDRPRARISHAVQLVELERDKADIDGFLARLEAML